MEAQKPIISNQITIEQITKSCDDDIKSFTELFFNLEYTSLNSFNLFVRNTVKILTSDTSSFFS